MAERPFGPYQLVRQVAVGGMAEIHLAKTRGLAGFEKFVALKMIHPNFAQDEQFIEMLIDEAKIAVQLQHVNIAHTFDLGRVGETYYIVMEFVDGADLYQILRKGSERDLEMPIDVAAFVAKEMANGLDYAHRKRDSAGQPMGIVHRDVSPQNVLVSTAGEVKLVDFGIAKATMKVRQTAVGVIKGKYYYMSPEQARGERIDLRSDIFSAGIVLYEMLTSQMLYLEEDIPRLLDMVRKADIAPVRTLRPDVPPQLERIVMRALAKRAADRYPSAGELATDLERFLHAYAPAFAAPKLATHLERALGQEAEELELETTLPLPTPRRAGADGAVRRHTLVTQRSEISDENSVIFRVGDLARPGRHPGADPQAARASPRMITASTIPIGDGDGDGDGDVDSTMVSARPDEASTAYDGPRGLRKAAVAAALGDDYEPTVVEASPGGAGFDDDGGPTQTRDAFPARVAEAPTAPRRRGEPPAALRANVQAPAISELRRPRESRRTPAGGVPAVRPPPVPAQPPSLLRAIVGEAPPGQAMPAPARGAGAPLSDGVPSQLAEAASSRGATEAVGGRGGAPGRPLPERPADEPWGPAFDSPTSPSGPVYGAPPPLPVAPAVPTPGGMPAYPQAYPTGLPPHMMPYGYGAADPASGYAPPGYAPPGYAPPGYAPPGYGQPPATLSRQLQALEVDEMPAQYRLSTGRPWLVRALLALVLIGAGVAAAVLIVRSGQRGPAAASVTIESRPTGATVAVDGRTLDEKTPTVVHTKPGARHDIDVTLAGYQPFHDAVAVPEGGGDLKVLAFLSERTVTLTVTTTPPGADIYLNGVLKGRAPMVLADLAPGTAVELEVRLKDFAPERKTLTWDRDAQTVDFRLRR
ncbi:MAG: protein kinase [Kofleriaceae bacterium]